MAVDGRYSPAHGNTLPDLLRQVDGKYENLGWDQPAALYFIYVLDESPEMVMWEVSEVEFMREAYEKGGMVADALTKSPAAIAARRPDNLYGYLLVTEGWALSAEDVTEDEARKIADERQIHSHPQAREQRLYLAHTREGHVFFAKRERGKDLESFSPKDFPEGLMGAVPDGLAALQRATFRPRVNVN